MSVSAFAAPALVGAASIAISVWLALPAALPGRPATLLMFPGNQTRVLAALTTLDPEMRLLGIRASGLLLAIQYQRPDLPARISGSGVIAVIGAGTAGCKY